MARFLSASFVRLGDTVQETADTGNSHINSNITGGKHTEGEDSQLQRQDDTEEWDREMEQKADGWEKQWDQERQRFYYFNPQTWESSYAAPFKISVSFGAGRRR